MTRSLPAAFITAITSARCSGTSCAPRVASERKNTRSPSRELARIRSPSSAPPPLRRVGSTAMTAMRSLSCWSVRKRRTISSVRLDLPDPPVPVMPSTGTTRLAAARRTSVEQRLVEATALGAGDRAGDGEPVAREHLLDRDLAVGPQVDVAVGDDRVDHPDEAHLLAVLGGEDRDAGLAQPLDLLRHDDAATAAHHAHVARARGAQRLDEVLEVLHVAALVGRHRDALDVLLQRGVDDLLHRAVVAEVDDLAALAHEDPPHDVDRGVVAVEQRGRRDEADRVRGGVQVGHGSIVGLPTNTRESPGRPRRDPRISGDSTLVGRNFSRQAGHHRISGKSARSDVAEPGPQGGQPVGRARVRRPRAARGSRRPRG